MPSPSPAPRPRPVDAPAGGPVPFVRVDGLSDAPALGTWSVELESGRGHCSGQACAILGLARGSTPTLEQLLDCFAPEYRDWLNATFQRCIDEGRWFDVEAEVLREGDTRVWIRLTCEAQWDAATGSLHLLGAVQDVTPNLRVQDDLHESQRAIGMLMGNLPGMAYRAANRDNWPLEFASEGAWELTGYRPSQLLAGQPQYGDLMHPDDRERVWYSVQLAVARRQRFQLSYRLRTHWGEKWVWEQGCGVFKADGQLRCLEGFVIDITQARQAQSDLKELNQSLEARVRERTHQLETANQELKSFAHSIAHDLRAPMTALAGFARLLEEATPAGQDRAAHYLRRIMGNVTQMSELTEALLALARLSGVDIEWAEVDLGELAQAAVAQLHEQEPQRRIDIRIASGLQAHGDRRLLQQVMANLVGNAWKFSRGRDTLQIEVGCAQEPDGDRIVFFVRDRGVGFDMAHADQLFGAFRRLHGRDEFEGTGIGLALVRKIVQRHGGRVWAESQLDNGTTIFFSLPGPGGTEPAVSSTDFGMLA